MPIPPTMPSSPGYNSDQPYLDQVSRVGRSSDQSTMSPPHEDSNSVAPKPDSRGPGFELMNTSTPTRTPMPSTARTRPRAIRRARKRSSSLPSSRTKLMRPTPPP
jgi:hypothetical protein